jgi:hypothetical protein
MKRKTTGFMLVSMTVGVWAALFLAGKSGAVPPDHSRAGGLPACEEEVEMCTLDLESCEDDLAACEARPQFGIPGDGTGNGPALSYEECADGLTVADLNTGFLWERKVEGGSISVCDLTNLHLVDSRCLWSDATGAWIDAVNAEGGTGFAGFSDWRVPNVKELQSIVDYSTVPSIDTAFDPTASSSYWSATSSANNPGNAWFVGFNGGRVDRGAKSNPSNPRHVRAVRTGPCPEPLP